MTKPIQPTHKTLDLRTPVQALHLKSSSSEARFEGAIRTSDGATIDAATTTWPGATPSNTSVDAGGLIDFEASGLRLVSRDAETHSVVAVPTGKPSPTCEMAHLASPCLVVRTAVLARTRLMTRDELLQSSTGAITVESSVPPLSSPPAHEQQALLPSLAWLAGVWIAAGVAVFALVVGWERRKRERRSPNGELKALAARVQKKLKVADRALSATLTPVVTRLAAKLRTEKLDATSAAGERIRQALVALENALDDAKLRASSEREQRIADELITEMQASLDAANEAMRAV